MKMKKIVTMLAFVLASVLASNAHGKITLTADNQNVSSITLEVGQSCTVEVVSSDSTAYEAHVGYYRAPIIGDFSLVEIKPEAGKDAEVHKHSTVDFRGYYVKADNGIFLPSPGVHFVFQFEAREVGETDVSLYDDILKTELDSLHITVTPAAMGTVFTYQGRLIHNSEATDGPHDFEFKLYDSPFGGNQLADTIDINNLDVIDGYFTVELDFNDPNVFNGDACWLGISVRPGDSNSFTTLSPRQQLTPTPYAIYAANAGPDSDWMVSGDNMYSIPSGRVGIGTISPSSKLHVEDDTSSDVKVTINNLNDAGSERLYFGSDAGIIAWGAANSSNPSKWRFFNNRTSGNYDWVTSGSIKMTLANNGYLGIGTTGPEAKLHIRSTYPEVRFEESDQSDKKWSIAGYNSGLAFIETGEGYAMYIDEGGRVGIGTTSPAQKLDVSGYVVASRYYDRDNTSYYLDPSSTGYSAKFAGNVGIGTTAPSSKLHVQGSSTGEVKVTINNQNSTGTERLYFGSDTGIIAWGSSNATYPGKCRFFNNRTSANYDWITSGSIKMTLANNGNLGIGTTAPAAKLDVAGRTRTEVLEITGGSDLSEQFEIKGEDQKVEPGMIVCIDPVNCGNLVVSQKAYDRTVAGIVSGAGGVKPGMLMGQKGTMADGEHPVALTGRVYCRADASNGPIAPGDLLTTSDVAGHAMKVTDYDRSQGAILGKAMSSLEEGRGLVLVLVSLQ
jgi:hypothetical protein